MCSRVLDEGHHDYNEHDPVEDVEQCKWQYESKPKWPLSRPAAAMSDTVGEDCMQEADAESKKNPQA